MVFYMENNKKNCLLMVVLLVTAVTATLLLISYFSSLAYAQYIGGMDSSMMANQNSNSSGTSNIKGMMQMMGMMSNSTVVSECLNMMNSISANNTKM